jgi:hypothetical protein
MIICKKFSFVADINSNYTAKHMPQKHICGAQEATPNLPERIQKKTKESSSVH